MGLPRAEAFKLLSSLAVAAVLAVACRGCARTEEPAEAVTVKPRPKPKPQWAFSEPLKEDDHEPGGLARQGAFALAREEEDGTLQLFASSGEDELSTGALGLKHLLGENDGGAVQALELDGGALSPGLARWAGQRVRLYRGPAFACLGEVIGLRALLPPAVPHDKRPQGTGAAVIAVVRPESKGCAGANWGRWALFPVPAMAAPLDKVAPTEARRLQDRVLEAFRAMPRYQEVQQRYLAQVHAAEEEANKTRATELDTNDAVQAVLAHKAAAAGADVLPEDLGAPGSAAAQAAAAALNGAPLSEAVEPAQPEETPEPADSADPASDPADTTDTIDSAGELLEPEQPLFHPKAVDAGREELRWDAPARNLRPAIALWRMVKTDKTYAAAYSRTGSCEVPGGELGALFDVVTEGGDTMFVLWNELPDVHLPRVLLDADGDGTLEIADDEGLFQRVDGGYRQVQGFPPTTVPDGGCQ